MNFKKSALFLARGGIIAALYVVLTFVFAPISFGPIQVRIAEALTILPMFTPAAVPGLFVGCLVGNILGGAILPDIIFGSLATLIGAAGTYALRENRFLCAVPPIVSTMLIIPFVLSYAYHIPGSIPFFMLTVGIGELISCMGLGQLLLSTLLKVRGNIFQ